MTSPSLPTYFAKLLAEYPFIPHRNAVAILDELEFLLEHRIDTGKAVGERLAGDTNVGKTTVMVNFVRLHPPVKTDDGWTYPVVYLHLPEKATLDDVYAELLRALGDPAAYTGTLKEKRARCRALVDRTGVMFVFVDEPHHLTESRSEGSRLGTTQLAKVFVDMGLTVVFGGVHSVDDLVVASPELARRFPGRLHLRPYDVGSPDDLDHLRVFANRVGERLTRVAPIAFGSDNEWFARLAVVSNGYPGGIVTLVSQAESRARRAGDKVLTLKHFSQAWARFEHSQDVNIKHLRGPKTGRLANVFDLDLESVAALLGSMANRGTP